VWSRESEEVCARERGGRVEEGDDDSLCDQVICLEKSEGLHYCTRATKACNATI